VGRQWHNTQFISLRGTRGSEGPAEGDVYFRQRESESFPRPIGLPTSAWVIVNSGGDAGTTIMDTVDSVGDSR